MWVCPVGYVGSTVADGAWVVPPVRCGRYGVLYSSESSIQPVLCFGCGCVGAFAGWYTVDNSVKGVGVVGGMLCWSR